MHAAKSLALNGYFSFSPFSFLPPGSTLQVYRGWSTVQYNWAKQSPYDTGIEENIVACSSLLCWKSVREGGVFIVQF
jgi:hypothetical protein